MPRPTPIETARHAPPDTGKIAWTACPKPNALLGYVKVEDKERARGEIERLITADGYDPGQCEILWTYLYDAGWGWSAKVREDASRVPEVPLHPRA